MINGEALTFDASHGLTVEVTMEVSADAEGQVFWTSNAEPFFSEGKSTKFPVKAGGCAPTPCRCTPSTAS